MPASYAPLPRDDGVFREKLARAQANARRAALETAASRRSASVRAASEHTRVASAVERYNRRLRSRRICGVDDDAPLLRPGTPVATPVAPVAATARWPPPAAKAAAPVPRPVRKTAAWRAPPPAGGMPVVVGD